MAHNADVTYAYAADIYKVDKTPDGHLLVYGKAAGPEVDLDEQICDPGWLAKEMPAWMEWGNIRAQHGPVAAGVGKELTKGDGDVWNLLGKIVDADSKVKVENDVYKGYSIGIKGARVVPDPLARKGRIVGGKIVEVSLVDRPCNPTATLSLVKAAGMTREDLEPATLEELAEESSAWGADTLIPLDVEGKAVQPDVAADGEEIGDVEKGFLQFLAGPKQKPKHGQHGRFASTEAAKKQKLTAREKRVAAREAKNKERAAATARAITENRVSAEALNDATAAMAGGRHEEAMGHLSDAALHAHDSSSRRNVRAASMRIGKSAVADGVMEPAELDEMLTEMEEILGGELEHVALTVPEFKAATAVVRGVLAGEIVKMDGLDEPGDVDESADIEASKQVIRQIADLMISELNELKTGRLDELGDVETLMSAMHAMCRFLNCEEREDGGAGGDWDEAEGYEGMDDDALSYVAMAALGELEKRAEAQTLKGVMPDAVKRFFSAKSREHLADTGAALPDGSFPITDQASLDDAAHLAGNAKDPQAAREHIRKRAKTLGLSLPESWTAKAAGPDDDRVSILEAELTKAAEAKQAHEAEMNDLRAQLARVENMLTKTAAPARVALIAQPSMPPAATAATTEADRLRREANRPDINPSVRDAYLARAADLEG